MQGWRGGYPAELRGAGGIELQAELPDQLEAVGGGEVGRRDGGDGAQVGAPG
jgi:hypothetical protein